MAAEDWPNRCRHSNLRTPMAGFCLISIGVESDFDCDLPAACWNLRLRDDINGLIFQQGALEATAPSR